jgi:hypothetical protein
MIYLNIELHLAALDSIQWTNERTGNRMSKANLGKTGDPATEEFLRTSSPVFLPGRSSQCLLISAGHGFRVSPDGKDAAADRYRGSGHWNL